MPTINQLIRKPRTTKPKRNKVPAMEQNPQKRGVCSRVYTTTRDSMRRRCRPSASRAMTALPSRWSDSPGKQLQEPRRAAGLAGSGKGRAAMHLAVERILDASSHRL